MRQVDFGTYIVRYEIPEGVGITWEETLEPGHYDLQGDKDVLKSCLADFVAEVQGETPQEVGEQ